MFYTDVCYTYLLTDDVYVPVGGLAAVIYTDTLQMFVMVIGAFVLTVISQYLVSFTSLY